MLRGRISTPPPTLGRSCLCTRRLKTPAAVEKIVGAMEHTN